MERFAESWLNFFLSLTDIVFGTTIVPKYSNWERKEAKNLSPSPPLLVPIKAILPIKQSRQFFVESETHVIAFVNIGGDPPLYSGAQKIKALLFSNSWLNSWATSLSVSIPGIYNGRLYN